MITRGTKTADTLAGRLMLVSAVLFAVAFVAILTAHMFERYGGYLPCHLCLQERYAYYFGVPASIVAFFAARRERFGFTRIVLVLIAIGFLFNAGLGIYHSGVEWKWWPGPVECSGGSVLSFGASGVDIANAKVVACDQAAWRLLGLSFAGWTAVVSLFLAALAAWGALLRR
jgi:disulfide bond formation protein DsbB